MSDVVKTSFTYDPVQQGYDTNTWKTISGVPAVQAGRLFVDAGAGTGSAIHYVDAVKGDVVFDVNIPTAPGVDSNRSFGMSNAVRTKYVVFTIGGALRCETKNVVDSVSYSTTSSDIGWNSDWTGADVEFRIRWEAGTVKFFVNGTQVYAISDQSVPYGPLSIYLADESGTAMTFGDISVLGTQSYVEAPKTDDDTQFAGIAVGMSQLVSIAENVSMLQKNYVLPAAEVSAYYESVSVAENVVVFNSHRNISVNDSVAVSSNLV